MTPHLEELRQLTNARRKVWRNPYYDEIGLRLANSLENPEYYETPINSLTFAYTGEDGIHYSFLCDGRPTDNDPIIMTIPLSDVKSFVVGDSLLDFLALGCRTGYSLLELLYYDPDSILPKLDSHIYHQKDSGYSREKDRQQEKAGNERFKQILKQIEDHFQLKPWTDHAAKLEQLRQKHAHKMIFREDY